MKKFRYLLVCLFVIFDQLVKFIVRKNMMVGDSIDVIGRIFSITYVRNSGAAFGSLMGKSIILKFAPIVLVILMIVLLEKYINSHILFTLSMIFIISGGIGNLIDRWVLGYVTDMFDFHFWPVFNVADIFVVVGCIILIAFVMFFDKEKEKEVEWRK